MSTAYTDTEASLVDDTYIIRKNPLISYNLMILLEPVPKDVRIMCILSRVAD
jgi:hypothetical protein